MYKANDDFKPTAVNVPSWLLEYGNVLVNICKRCNVEYTKTTIVDYAAQDINELYKDIVEAMISETTGLTDFSDKTQEQILQDIKRIFEEETAGKQLTPQSWSEGFVECLYFDADNGELCLNMSAFRELLTFSLTSEEAATLNAIDTLKSTLENNSVNANFVNVDKLGGSRYKVTRNDDRISKAFMTAERFNAAVYAEDDAEG